MNRWLEQLSNWQYVAFMVSAFALALIITGGILGLISGFVELRVFLTVYLTIAAVFIAGSAWKRWK